MKLEKWQRNALFAAIEAGALDPRECDFEQREAEAHVVHPRSGGRFTLGQNYRGDYTGTSSVGDSSPSQYQTSSWSKVESEISRWASDVKHDAATPDLWVELRRERDLIMLTDSEIQNAPFSEDERIEIAHQLRDIREDVKRTYSISAEGAAVLDTRFEELEAALGRLGRLDWRGLFLGVMFTVIVTGVLPPEVVQEVVKAVLEGLRWLYTDGPPPNPLNA